MKPNEIGRKQFYDFQTEGMYGKLVSESTYNLEKRKQLDDYFWVLFEGKESFDLMVSEYRNLYNIGDWWGWYRLLEDWGENAWLIKYLCKWHNNIPDFIKNIKEE